ncbi:hypothetical protein ACJX0J_005802, partial [Zea mays]
RLHQVLAVPFLSFGLFGYLFFQYNTIVFENTVVIAKTKNSNTMVFDDTKMLIFVVSWSLCIITLHLDLTAD